MFSSSFSSSSVSLALRPARSRSRTAVPVSSGDNANATGWQIDPKHAEPLTLGSTTTSPNSSTNSTHQNDHYHHGHQHDYHHRRAQHAHVPPFTLAEFEHFVCAAFDPSSARSGTRLSSGSGGDGSKSPNPNPHPRRNLPSAQPGGASSAAPSSNSNANFGAGDNLNPDYDYQCRGVVASEIGVEDDRLGLAESNPADAHGEDVKYLEMSKYGVTRTPSSSSKRRSTSSGNGRGREKRKHTRANSPHALAGMGMGSIGKEDDYQDDGGGHCQLAQERVVGSAVDQWEAGKRNFGYTNRINMPLDSRYNRHHNTVSSYRRRASSSSSLLRASRAKSLPSRTKASPSSNHRPLRLDIESSFGFGLENIPEFKETEVSEIDFVELKEIEETRRKKYEIRNLEKKGDETRISKQTPDHNLRIERFEAETEAAQCSFIFGIGNSSGNKSGDPLKSKPASKLKRNRDRKPTPKSKQLAPNDMILITPPSSVPSAHNQSQHPGQGLTAASTSTIDVGLSGCMSVSLSASGASSAGTSVYISTTSPFSSRGTSASATTTTTNKRTRTKAKTNGYASGWADSNSKVMASSSSSAGARVGSTLRRRLSAIHMPTSTNAAASGSGSSTKRNNEHLPVLPTAEHNSLSIRTTSSAPNLFARIKKQLSRNSMVEVQLHVEGGSAADAIERENERKRTGAEGEELKTANKKSRSRKLSKKNKKLAKKEETESASVVKTPSIQPPSSSIAAMSTSSLPLATAPGVEPEDVEEHASASDSDSSTKTTKTVGSASGKKKKKRSPRNRRNRSKQRKGSGSAGGSELDVVNVNGGTSSPSMYSCDSAPLGMDTEVEVGGAPADYTPYVPLVVQQERALMAGRKLSSTSTSSSFKQQQQQQPLIRQRSSIFRASSPPPLVHPAPSTRLPPSPSSSQKQKQKQKHRPVSFTITPAPAVEMESPASPASPTSPTSPTSPHSLSPPMSPISPTSLSPPLSPSSPTFGGSGTYSAGYAYAYEYGAAAARRQSWASVLSQGSGSRSSMESRGPVTPGPMTAGGGAQGFVVVVTGTESDEDEDDNATRTSTSSLSAHASSQKSVQSKSPSVPIPMTKKISRQSLNLGTHPASPPPSIPLPLPPNSPRKPSHSGATSSAVFPSSYKSTNNMSNDRDKDSEIDLVQSHLSAIDASSDHVDLDSVLGVSLYENGGGGIDTYPYSYARSSHDSFITAPDDYTRVHDIHPTDTFVYGHAYATAGAEENTDDQDEDEDEYFRSFASSPASLRRLSSSSPSVYATLRTRESFSAPSTASFAFGAVAAAATSGVVQREREVKKIGVGRQVVIPTPSSSAGCAASKATLKEDANCEKGRGQKNAQAHSGEWTLGLGSSGSIVPAVGIINGVSAAAQKPVQLQSDTESSVYTISGSITTTASNTSKATTTTTEGPVRAANVNVSQPLVAAVQTQPQTRPRTNTVPHPYAPFSTSKTHHLLSVPTAFTASSSTSSSTRERTQSDPSSISSSGNVNEDWTLNLGVPSKLKSQLKSLSSKSPLVKERNSDPILVAKPPVELIINVEDVDDVVRDSGSRTNDSKKAVVESIGVPMDKGAEVDFCVPRVVQNGRGMDDDAFLGVEGTSLSVRSRSRQALANIPVLKEEDEEDEAKKVEEKVEDGQSGEHNEEDKDPRSRALMNAKANLATLDALSEDLRKFNEMLKAAANEGIVPKLAVRSKQSLDVLDRTHQKLATKKSRSVLQIDEPPPPNAVLRGMPSVDTLFVDVVGAGVELGVDAFDVGGDEKEPKADETTKGPVSIPMAEFTRGPTRPRMTSRASSIVSNNSSNLSTKAPLPFAPFRSIESKPVKVECATTVNGGSGSGRALTLREATALGPVSAFEHIHPRPSVSVSSGKQQLKITTTTSQLSQKLTSPSSSSLDSFASCESAASASSSTSSTPTVTPTRMAFASSLSLDPSSSSAPGPTFPPVVSPVYTHVSPVLHATRTRKTALSISRKSPPLVLPKLASPPPTLISTHTMSPTSPFTPSAESLLSPLTPAASAFPMPPPLSVPLPPLPSREIHQQRMLDPVGASVRAAREEEEEGTSGEESMDSMEYYSARSSFSL